MTAKAILISIPIAAAAAANAVVVFGAGASGAVAAYSGMGALSFLTVVLAGTLAVRHV